MVLSGFRFDLWRRVLSYAGTFTLKTLSQNISRLDEETGLAKPVFIVYYLYLKCTEQRGYDASQWRNAALWHKILPLPHPPHRPLTSKSRASGGVVS